MLASVGQGYVISALARYLIEHFIDIFLVESRLTLVRDLQEMEEETLRSPVGPVVEGRLTLAEALRQIASKG